MQAIEPSPQRARIEMGQAFLPVIHCRDSFILIESPRGCLKTVSILNILMMRAYQYPGLRWYLWRSTRALLSTTVLPSFEEYVIPAWSRVPGMRLMNPNARPTQRTEYVFENGSVFLPIGLDDVLRGTSSEGAGGYLAEAIELGHRDQAVALVGMMRQPGIPFHQIIIDVNPGPPGHWTNLSAEPVSDELRRVTTRADYDRLQQHNRTPAKNPKDKWKRVVAKIQDNVHYFDLDNWRLKPAGQKYLNGLGNLNGHLKARWVDGLWRSAEGGVFPEFVESIHVMDEFAIPMEWPQFVGIDPGYDHPCAILWFAVAPNGNVYIVNEQYTGGLSVQQHAENIHRDNKGRNVHATFADPQHAWSRTAQSPKPIAAQFAEKGIRVRPWPRSTQKQPMVEAVRKLLNERKLKVFRRCVNTISEFGSWAYKRNTKGEQLTGDDQYEDKNNHAMDVVCGVVAAGVQGLARFSESRIRVIG